MQKSYKAFDGQTTYDVCLQVYGSLDNLVKLLIDSGVDNINAKPKSQQKFTYDDTLVTDQVVSNQFLLSNIIYATDTGDNGNAYYILKQPSPPPLIKTPVDLPTPPNLDNMYEQVNNTSFTSGADGTTVFTPLDKDGNSMIGADIVQIEIEIRPLRNTDYVWNKNLGTVTLQGGVVIDNNQTAFILYKRLVTN